MIYLNFLKKRKKGIALIIYEKHHITYIPKLLRTTILPSQKITFFLLFNMVENINECLYKSDNKEYWKC